MSAQVLPLAAAEERRKSRAARFDVYPGGHRCAHALDRARPGIRRAAWKETRWGREI